MKNKYVIIAVVVFVLLIVGLYFWNKSKKEKTETTSKSTSETKSGLSSLLGNLNLSGLNLSVI